MAETKAKPWNELDFIIEFEGGDLSEDEVIEGFQHLVDNGHAWMLQGMYGRTAADMIRAGVVKDTHNVLGLR